MTLPTNTIYILFLAVSLTVLRPTAITAVAAAASGRQVRWWDQRSLRRGRQMPGAADRAVRNVSDLRDQPSRPGMDGREAWCSQNPRSSGIVQWNQRRKVLGNL